MTSDLHNCISKDRSIGSFPRSQAGLELNWHTSLLSFCNKQEKIWTFAAAAITRPYHYHFLHMLDAILCCSFLGDNVNYHEQGYSCTQEQQIQHVMWCNFLLSIEGIFPLFTSEQNSVSDRESSIINAKFTTTRVIAAVDFGSGFYE